MTKSSTEKQLIIVGGPNGSGKTTLALEIVAEKEITYISADDIAYELNPENPEEVRIRAGKEFFSRLDSAIQNEENILIESTLSGKTIGPIIKRCKNKYNYSVVIVFIFVSNVDFCAERVAIRVQKGGHDVPLVDIKRRFHRSMKNFWINYRHECDLWYLYFNADDDFQEVARHLQNEMYVLDESLFIRFKQMVKKDE